MLTSFKTCIYLWQSLIILRWSCKIEVLTNQQYIVVYVSILTFVRVAVATLQFAVVFVFIEWCDSWCDTSLCLFFFLQDVPVQCWCWDGQDTAGLQWTTSTRYDQSTYAILCVFWHKFIQGPAQKSCHEWRKIKTSEYISSKPLQAFRVHLSTGHTEF